MAWTPVDSNDSPDLILRAKLAITRARINAKAKRDDATVAAGGALGRFGRRVVLSIHREEQVLPPGPITIGVKRFDVVDDLRHYTELPAGQVDALLRRRSDSFRAEWFLTPSDRRLDDWFYRSSTTYLFGNAVHDPSSLLGILRGRGVEPGRALDFGGGTGNLALALAAEGWSVDYLEHSALQKDFVAFRVDTHELGERVRVLNDWRPLEADAYDVVFAVDVLEHVADLEGLLLKRLLPAIRHGGRLIESSPFVRSLSNPMHHEHSALDSLLDSSGFELEADGAHGRVWLRGDKTNVSARTEIQPA